MKYKIFVNNPWQQNTIILYDETKEAAVIDCGCLYEKEKENMSSFIKNEQLNVVALWCTHLHLDHIFGNQFMLDKYGIRALASADDSFLLDNFAEHSASLGISGLPSPPSLGGYIKDGDVLRFGNTTLKVIAVAGHSPGGICLYNEAEKIIFVGDVLFKESVGRSDLPGGDGRELLSSIKSKLFTLPDDVIVIPGHGEKTTIGYEKELNPFFL